jgi:hypothetical protein
VNGTTPSLFDGPEYVPERDNVRLSLQIARVWRVMSDGEWRTLEEISIGTSRLRDDAGIDPPASISAQLRHLRKERFGGHTIERRGRQDSPSLYEYKLIPSEHGLLDGARGGETWERCPACGQRMR